MKKTIRLISAVIILSMLTLSQAQACYTQREFEAEQGLRIHSELMVIGLTCIKMPGGSQLYSKYQKFTKKNSILIASYEADIIHYFKNKGFANPELKFHTLRTNLANEISQRAIKMSTVNFCNRYASRLDQALGMDHQKVRQWASQVWANQPTSEPVCQRTAYRD